MVDASGIGARCGGCAALWRRRQRRHTNRWIVRQRRSSRQWGHDFIRWFERIASYIRQRRFGWDRGRRYGRYGRHHRPSRHERWQSMSGDAADARFDLFAQRDLCLCRWCVLRLLSSDRWRPSLALPRLRWRQGSRLSDHQADERHVVRRCRHRHPLLLSGHGWMSLQRQERVGLPLGILRRR